MGRAPGVLLWRARCFALHRRRREPGSKARAMPQRWGVPFVAWPSRLRPSYWDGVALPLVIGTIMLIAWASQQMSMPYHAGQELPISLDPRMLPEYGLRTVMRMVLALAAS